MKPKNSGRNKNNKLNKKRILLVKFQQKLKEFNMENSKERVLAYNKAKVIEQDELVAVSGGAGVNWTSLWTAGGSAGSGQPSEGHLDVSIDF